MSQLVEYTLETVKSPEIDRHEGEIKLRLEPAMLCFWFSRPPVGQSTYINGIWAFRGTDGSYVELYDWCPMVHGEDFWNMESPHDYYIDGDGDLEPFIDWLRVKCGAMIISIVEPKLIKYKEHLEQGDFKEALSAISSARKTLPEEPRIISKEEFKRLFDVPLPKKDYSMPDVDVLETTRSLVSFFKRYWLSIAKADPALATVNLNNHYTFTARTAGGSYDETRCLKLDIKDKLQECEVILRLNELHKLNLSVRAAVKKAFILDSQLTATIAAQLDTLITFFNTDAVKAHPDRVTAAWLPDRPETIKEDLDVLKSTENLQLLCFSGNKLGEHNDLEIPSLPKLISINLNGNCLSKIPSSLSNCPNLQLISLCHNEFTDFEIDLSVFQNLKCVDLRWNPITYEQSRKIKERHKNIFFLLLPIDELYDEFSAVKEKSAEERLAVIDKLYEMAPENFDICQNRGAILDELKRHDEAMVCHKRLIDLRPISDAGYYNAACCLALQGQADEACDYLKQSLEYCADNLDYAAKDSAFDSIRDTECYKELYNA